MPSFNPSSLNTPSGGGGGAAGVDATARANAATAVAAAQAASAGNAPVVVANTPATQVLTAAQNAGRQVYDLTLTQNTALSLAGGKPGLEQTIVLVIRQGGPGGYAATLPAGIRWAGGAAPVPNTAAGRIDRFVITTPDGGTTWFGGSF